jgi:hypothetical protein
VTLLYRQRVITQSVRTSLSAGDWVRVVAGEFGNVVVSHRWIDSSDVSFACEVRARGQRAQMRLQTIGAVQAIARHVVDARECVIRQGRDHLYQRQQAGGMAGNSTLAYAID